MIDKEMVADGEVFIVLMHSEGYDPHMRYIVVPVSAMWKASFVVGFPKCRVCVMALSSIFDI